MGETFQNIDKSNDATGINNPKAKTKTPILDCFGRNLTQLAIDGKLDPVYDRDKEIEEIIQVLNKRKKNNPILVGGPGVGKTAVVEGIAIKIAKKDVDVWLLNKKIIEINITSLVSGTKYRGDFEQRMEELIKEIERNPDVIIFIDEIHNVIGAGGSASAMDASNILKPALSSGIMKCIGATTLDEYKKTFEGEGAFERRFQKIYIKEPSKKEVIDILMGIKSKYEEYHNVEFSEEVIKECVNLSEKYINYRKFPDKAIDLLDETGSKVKLKNIVMSEHLKKLEEEIENIEIQKKEASKNQRFEEAAGYRDDAKRLIIEIDKERNKWEKSLRENKTKVKVEDVASIISSHTGIPITKLTNSESKKMLEIGVELKKNIVGQDEAIQKVEEAIQRSRLGIQDPNKPIVSLLFLGSTGVGKSYLAKTLANHLFDSDDSFVRIDMSEYGESHSVSKLIGSPPGYIGFDDKGQLTEKVKNRPYSIILFDEIEKAHQDVFNVFLQILDDGKLTDGSGGEINFKNTIIIMTSNLGTRNLIEGNNLGFRADKDVLVNDKSIVIKELEKHFKPEFLNRIDEKIIFNPLGKEQIKEITKIELGYVLDRIKEKEYQITFSDEVADYISEIGFDKKYGARPIKRTIIDKIGNLITKAILNNEINVKDKYRLVMNKEKIEIKKIK